VDSLSDVMSKIEKFCIERDWDQYHDPKELAIGLSTEANELLDIFRFKRESDMIEIMSKPESRERVSQELADIFFFLLRFAQYHNFDLLEALNRKMQINEQKYPIEKARGSNRKYNEYD
jgi:NTP pyrophosphatase (non-canonical NTP hydrolase)